MALIKPTPVFGEKQLPAPEFKEQYLFLLEFYIHELRGDRLAKLNQMFFVPTCVGFQFLNFKDDDLEVTPVDPMFEPQAGISDDVEYFYSGRSIMFSVAQYSVTQKISEFKIKLTVRKKMPEDINPDILVGEAEVDMTKQFAALRKEMLQCWYLGVPPPQVFENDVPLFFKEDLIGSIKVFIRLSSYGQSITTEFEAPGGNKSYIFKGNKINDKGLSYKCRVIDSKEFDLCKESEDDFSKKAPCEVCQPKRHPCLPCGLSIGAVVKQGLEIESNLEKCLKQADFLFGSKVQEREGGKRQISCKPVSENLSPSGKRTGPIQSSRGPAQPCGKAVVLKVSGLLDDGENKQPTVTVANEFDAQNCDPDPDHDVFILRIGKKGLVGPDEKSDLQLEMRTPKGPERRAPIRHETREAQTEEEAKVAKKAKSGKSKKK
ncbi:uncharacterized protein LOC117177529 [Belonocnema kinseyi]|uniref:uncharacterized protein LOC117177529 n=1 Tax=Belonocnema kinseyi TaxID=2817044 RepID=UPI00143D23EE|nr:uncharacterized protein LOC117177529 [Belonocnema kinseyi]